MAIPVYGLHLTNANKANMIETLQLAFEQGGIHILKEPVLIAELQAFEATRLPSGLMRYAAPEGQHDDTVMALALAWAAVKTPHDRPVLRDFAVVGG